MGDGSKCKTLELSSGTHTIVAVFAKGNHVPYNLPVTDELLFLYDSFYLFCFYWILNVVVFFADK